MVVLEGHDGGVKSVAWDPKGEFLASLGFDGAAKVVINI
jgi:WD40 repeat protein